MSNQKIIILNCSKLSFTNEKTGEVKDMCMITYGVPSEETNEFFGFSILTGYVDFSAFATLKKNFSKLVDAKVKMVPNKSGFRWVIKSINNEDF